MLKLGKITLDVPFFQAALSGYSDQAMRLLALEYGAPLVFSGLMLDKSILHPGVLRKPLYAFSEREHPIGAQLLGTDPFIMARAAKILYEHGYDLIDMNFACPALKVIQRQRGGFLLTQPGTVIEIVQRVRAAVDCPVLVKLRIGFDDTPAARQNFWQICEKTAAAGVDAFIIHGRTVQERFRNRSNWNIILQVKHRHPRITVVGSGDLFNAEDIAGRLSDYAVDGAVIARGAIGNPWIFREARALIAGQPKPHPPPLSEQGRVLLRHFELLRQQYPPKKAVLHFRKFCIYYCRRHPQRKDAQSALITAPGVVELESAIKRWYDA